MSFKTGSTQIDGSINIDGSIFQWQQLFSGGGGGGGTGDVAWGSGNVGSNNQLITALGDGSIVAESNLSFDGANLDVSGNAKFTLSLSSEYTAALSNFKLAHAGGYGSYFGILGSGNSFWQAGREDGIAQYNLILQPQGGNIGIGNTNPGSKLDVTGNANISNELITSYGKATTELVIGSASYNYGSTKLSVAGDVSISGDIYMTGGKILYLSGSTGQIKYVSDELNLIGNNIHLNAATNIILEPFAGRVNILSDVSISSDLTVSSDIINPGMPNASTNYTVYFDTTTKKLSYADAPSGGDVDISTLSIESYVNTSTYYDSSIRYRTMPEPSTGFGSGNGAEGLFVNFKAANTISSYYCGYIDTGGRIALADADASNMMPAVAINTTGSSLSAGTNYNLLIYGVVRNTAWNFAIGQPVYVGLSGEVTTTMPSSAPDCVQVIGRTVSPDSIIFNPSPDFVVLK